MTVFNTTITTNELEKFFEEQEVLYKDYKDYRKDFRNYPQKKGTYNAEKKTIVLYVPKFNEVAKQIIDIYNNALLENGLPERKLEDTGLSMDSAMWYIVKASDEELVERYSKNQQNNRHISYVRFPDKVDEIIDIVRAYRATL